MMAKKDDEAEMKQRGLDISNRAREAGTEKTGFFQRLREGNIDDPNSAAYKKYGAGRARLDDQIETGKLKLADEVQEMVKARSNSERVSKDAAQGAKAPTPSAKVSDGMDESDRRREAAESAPKRMPTRPGQGTSGRKPSVSKVPKKPESSAPASKPADKPAAGTSSLRDPQQMAKQKEAPAASNKKPPSFEMPITRVLRAIRERGDADLKSRGMKKGGSINGIAKRGLTRCKTV
jgi:hypothetical protein